MAGTRVAPPPSMTSAFDGSAESLGPIQAIVSPSTITLTPTCSEAEVASARARSLSSSLGGIRRLMVSARTARASVGALYGAVNRGQAKARWLAKVCTDYVNQFSTDI